MDVRASDADRDAAADSLRAHCVAGRLTPDELEERVERAYAAKTVRELAELHADLPDVARETVPAPSHRSAARPPTTAVLPGTRFFHERIGLTTSRRQAADAAMTHIAPKLHAAGYRLEVRTEQMLCFVKPGRRPLWTILVAILLFPFGLLALLVRDREERVILSFDEPRPGRAVMTAEGTAPAAVRAAFRALG